MIRSELYLRIDAMDIKDIKRASIIDAALELGFTPKKVGRYYTLKEHDSVRIDPELNLFVRNSTGEAGSVIDFYMCFTDMTIGEVIEHISCRSKAQEMPEVKNTPVAIGKKELILPVKDDNERCVFSYLVKTRGIDERIVKYLIKRRLLYQDLRKNCVFVSYKDTKPVFAMLRGTNTHKRFVADVSGSDYSVSFFIGNKSDKLIITEGVIDALSIMTLFLSSGKDPYAYDYLVLSGSSKDECILTYLGQGTYKEMWLCLDNDEAGRRGSRSISSIISASEPGILIRDMPLFPVAGKDYNDYLMMLKGLRKDYEDEEEM